MIAFDWHPSPRKLRQFAATLGVFVLSWGSAKHVAVLEHAWLSALLALLLTLGVVGLRWPALVRHLFLATSLLAFPLGFLLSNALILVAFYALITPVAICMRLSGRDALSLKGPRASSYWRARERITDLSYYLRQ